MDVIIQEIESAGGQTHFKVEEVTYNDIPSYSRRFARASIPSWIDTVHIEWIGEKQIKSNDRPTDLIDAAAYDIANMQTKGEYPELLEVLEKLILSEDDRGNWDQNVIASAIKDLLP